jgi:type II secretory pathway predicted ATPase ExeA
MERFESAIDEELDTVRAGNGRFKAVRGEYGSGKTFFARWAEERAKRAGFAVSEVQISETETPLHRLETVYRRLMERLSTSDKEQAAFRRHSNLVIPLRKPNRSCLAARRDALDGRLAVRELLDRFQVGSESGHAGEAIPDGQQALGRPGGGQFRQLPAGC